MIDFDYSTVDASYIYRHVLKDWHGRIEARGTYAAFIRPIDLETVIVGYCKALAKLIDKGMIKSKERFDSIYSEIQFVFQNSNTFLRVSLEVVTELIEYYKELCIAKGFF